MKIRVETDGFIVEGDTVEGEYRLGTEDKSPQNFIEWELDDITEFVDVMRHHFHISFGSDPRGPE